MAGKKSKSKSSGAKTIHIKGYTRKDGTRVKASIRKIKK